VPTRWLSLSVPKGLVAAYAVAAKCRTAQRAMRPDSEPAPSITQVISFASSRALHAARGNPRQWRLAAGFSICRFCDTVIAKSLEMPEYPANEGLSPGFAKMRGPWTLSTTEAIVFALLVLAIAGAGTWASAIG
jgi:hypothetical protein